jgi:glycine/D-amino acid oxidase-like deaminating enzyme
MRFESGNVPSYWEKTTFLKPRDVIIIGTGIVGLSTALYLKKRRPELNVCVIERGSLPTGASTKNAGFACFGSPSELMADINAQGWEAVLTLVEKRWRGLESLRELVTDTGLQYIPSGGIEVFTEDQDHLFEQCADLLPQLNKNLAFVGKPIFSVQRGQPTWGLKNFAQAINCHAEGSIHPGKMIETLLSLCHSQSVHILNGVNVLEIEEEKDHCKVVSEHFIMRTKLLMLATNAFTTDLVPKIDLKPSRNQVLLTSKIPNLKLKGICHYDHGYVYFRNIDNRILIGGARNHFLEQEQTASFGNTENITNHLLNFLRRHIIPSSPFTIEQKWSGILGLGMAKTPIVQWQSDRIFMACRMGGMGISIGAWIGQMAAEAIASR